MGKEQQNIFLSLKNYIPLDFGLEMKNSFDFLTPYK